MNVLIKDKIRGLKEQIRTLELKKESLTDKVSIQQKNFIEELENRSQDDIKKKEVKISDLLTEENDCMNRNERLNDELKVTQQEIEEFSDSSKKLREFGNIRGKLSQKISTLVKEHKFFNDNTVYSTCNQDIEESFRVNRIEDSHNKWRRIYKRGINNFSTKSKRKRNESPISKHSTGI